MIIDSTGISELLNIKSPFRKLSKRTFPFYLFLTIFFSNYLVNVSFVITHHINTQIEISIAYLSLGLLSIFSFILISVTNPGYLRPVESSNYFKMLLDNSPKQICFDCKVIISNISQIVKPKRSKHCEVCDSCVKVYDHHCPWVGNCIGANNYKYFFVFLLSIELFVLFTIPFQISSNYLFIQI